MARPQSEAKLGFFPLPGPVTDLLLKHLEADDPGNCTILDPCAGEGVAIETLALGLGIPDDSVYLVELSESRASRIAGRLGAAHLLGPATFHGTEVSFNSFSLAYVNPPYSSEMGGGRREELSFLVRALNLVVPDGVVAMVVPEGTLLDYGSQAEAMRRTIGCRLSDITIWKPPDAHREYREVIVLGVKRKQPTPIPEGPLSGNSWYNARYRMKELGFPDRTYKLPAGRHPKNWRRVSFTPAELARKMAGSPLAEWLAPPRAAARPAPPLPPGRGHVALILAAGDLDGLVWPDGEPPHVVRGTATKVSFRDEAKCEERENEDGSTSSKEVWSERIVLVVRAISSEGAIYTYTDGEPDPCQGSGATSRPS